MTDSALRQAANPPGLRREPRSRRGFPVLGLPLLLAAFGAGCTLVESTLKLPVRAVKAVIPETQQTEPVDPVELQEQLLRFADNFTSSTLAAANRLKREGHPINRAELLTVKLLLASEAQAVVTGANALGNLVDMVVLTAGARIRVEDYWLPKVYGDSALPLLEALQVQESQIWALADGVFKPGQRAELREAIEQWHREKGAMPGSLAAFASIGLVAEVTQSGRRKASALPSSVFALLDIDPLAGLDPATRELAQARLFAERALYIGQRLPQLIEWRMELLTLRTAAIPEVRQWVESAARIAASGDRLSQVAEQMPAFIGSEREKIVAAFRSQEQGLATLAREAGQTLTQGTKMAEATDRALRTFHGVVAQFDRGPPKPGESGGEPFRIRDYAETAVEISRMSERLTALLTALQPNLNPETFARLSAEADIVAARAQQRGQALVDYAFRKAVLFVALSAAVLLGSGLIFRFVSGRMARSRDRDG